MSAELIRHPAFDLDRAASTLYDRGWHVEVIPVSSEGLLEVAPGEDVNCMDDRTEQGPDRLPIVHFGPKLPGGVYFLMAHQTGGDEVGLQEASRKIRETGYLPGNHGDGHKYELGCGYGFLWLERKLAVPNRMIIRPETVAERFRNRTIEGVYRRFEGPHTAIVTEFNSVVNTTRNKFGSNLVVDAWYGLILGLPQDTIINGTAEAVELLELPKRARILIPR